jgi:hypothetical protein
MVSSAALTNAGSEEMMRGLLKALLTVVPVIAVINMLGGVVGGIWAAINGDWWAIGYALLGMVGSPFVISILLMPGLAIAAAGMAAMKRRRELVARTAIAGSTLYHAVLMGGWALFVTAAFLGHPRESSLFPILLLAYGSSTGPWAYLASKDQQGGGNEFSAITVIFYQTGYLIGAVQSVIRDHRLRVSEARG